MPAPTPSRGPLAALEESRPGMVLALTLVILLLMSLMGMTIITGSRTELKSSSQASLYRDAFATADSAARMAVLIGRIFLHPESGEPGEILTSNDHIEVVIKRTEPLKRDQYVYDYTRRYLLAGIGEGAFSDGTQACIVFKDGPDGPVVATAVLSLDSEAEAGAGGLGGTPGVLSGGSLGGGGYEGEGGASVPVVLAISVNARAMSHKAAGGGTFIEATDEARSVITILYRELM